MSTKMFTFLLKPTGGVEQNPLNMSDEQILEEIYSTHVHSDIKLIDEHTLFAIVQNTLKRSTHIVDNLVQGSKANLDLDHHTDGSNTNQLKFESFDSPLCIIRKISSEMSCKLPPSGDIAHKTTLSILKKLSLNEWDAKAVLTLAAFAIEYGDIWLLGQAAQHESTDVLAKSMAVLKRVPILARPASVAKHRQAIIEINSLVKTTVQVIELILQFDSFATYNTKDIPALGPAFEQLPVHVYWSIITIAAIVTQIDCLSTESEHKQELSHYGQKINIVLSSLRRQITLCNQQIDDIKYDQRLWKLFQTPTEITEVLKVLIFPKDAPQSLFCVVTKTTVDISVLKKKNMYLFISTLDITEEEFSVVKSVYDSIKTNEQYKIVWIPIVEEWNEPLRKKFDILKSKMPWYVVHNVENVRGYKYIQREWNFKKKPMVVVLSPQGKIQNTDAFHLIQAYGIKAFPFTSLEEDIVNTEVNWVGSIVDNFNPSISNSVKEDKYIFFYGGKDKEWIQQFTKYATILANDVTIKEENISIELFCVEMENRSVINRFWNRIESLFVTKVHRKVDTVTQEVQKMLTYKNENCWALLSKGSSLVLSGHGTTILKTVTEFDRWKQFVQKKSFEVSFKQYHDHVNSNIHRCTHLDIPIVARKLPETIDCPDCSNTMEEVFISYKCCHNKNNTAANAKK